MDSPNSQTTSRLFDHLLLTAALSFAEEFSVDRERRRRSERLPELKAVLSARAGIIAELDELEVRAVRVARSLQTVALADDSRLLLEGYALLDLRRMQTAILRVHRHLLTLYPTVLEPIIERTRILALDLEVGDGDDSSGSGERVIDRLFAALELSAQVRAEIG